jgi:molybdopterin-guanine dinucleotide biosynthesis protein A
VDVASTVAGEIVLLGDLDLNIPGLSGIARRSDPTGCVGPLAGLSSLLEYAGSRWSLLLACDMPMLTVEVLERLIQARDESVDAVAFRRLDHECEFHACCAAYHPRALPAVRAELSTGVGKIQNVLRAVRCMGLIPAAEEEELLVNVNTPEDLASLEMRFAVTVFNCLQEDNVFVADRQ